MNYSKIKDELARQNKTAKDLCNDLDMSEQGFHQMIRNRSMKIDILEKITKYLGVHISYWFDDIDESLVSELDGSLKYETKPQNVYKKIDTLTSEFNKLLKSMIDSK